MKRIITLLIVIMFSLNASSQNVFPLAADSGQWKVFYGISFPCCWGITQTVAYSGDTVFCGYPYSVLQYDAFNRVYVRVENQKVYLRKDNNCINKEYLLYDFSLNVNDSAYFGWNILYPFSNPYDTILGKVVQVDTVYPFGIPRKRMEITFPESFWGNHFWIEGIGCTLHPFYSLTEYFAYVCECGYEVLCYDSANVLQYMYPVWNTCDTIVSGIENVYGIPVGISLYPSPASTELKVRNGGFKITNIEIYDVLGQRVFSQKLAAKSKELIIDVSKLDSGIYFLRTQGENEERAAKFVKE